MAIQYQCDWCKQFYKSTELLKLTVYKMDESSRKGNKAYDSRIMCKNCYKPNVINGDPQ